MTKRSKYTTLKSYIDAFGVRHLYVIVDPRDGLVHYVGATTNPEQRFKNHQSAGVCTPIGEWMQDMADSGVRPVFAVVAWTAAWTSTDEEAELIQQLRDEGHPLLNRKCGRPGRFDNVRHKATA